MMKKTIILTLITLLSFGSQITFAQNGTKKATLDDWMKEFKFYPRSVYGIRSMSDGVSYTTLAQRGTVILRSAYKSGEVIDTLLNLTKLNDERITSISDYHFSSDESKILLETNNQRIYRRSYTADFYIYNRKTKSIEALSENGSQQLATFSPDAEKIAFVRGNNIFIKDLRTKSETQITNDGKKNFIINGAPDWVYEEEFEFNRAFEWSVDGKYLAYIKFDESNVHEFSMTMFAGEAPEIAANKLYPENRVWKYPKAGEDNSLVSVHIYQLETSKTIKVDVGPEKDQYIPRIRWTKDASILCVFRENRLQNKLDLLLANADDGHSKLLYSESNKYYIDEVYFDDLQFLDDGNHFIMMSEKDGWAHLFLMDMNGNEVRCLTPGDFDVTEFIGFDAKRKKIYYQAAKQSPMTRDIFVVGLNGKGLKRLSSNTGTNHANFSASYKYFINNFSSLTEPTMVSLHDAKGKLIRNLQDNQELKDRLSSYSFSYPELFKFTTSEGIELNGIMLKPKDFDPKKKYPVLMTQYSGPNSQEVLDHWNFGWNQVMAAHGYIVVTVDGRGTGARGEAFRKVTYMQLGKYECTDQIETAKYLQGLDFVDPGRIGIWGWSFGGFISTLCMEKGDGIFKAGIAVAPVTNWRFYDNIYTERFMRTPQENPDGYDQNSPLFFADKLQGKFLICHGTADDNVHVQNTLEFTEKLVQANIQFEMQLYTNRNHSIYGGNTRYHLYTRKTNFLLNNL